MKIYIAIRGGDILNPAYTSLSSICKSIGVSYNSAIRGKRDWIKDGIHYRIIEITLIKIKRHK